MSTNGPVPPAVLLGDPAGLRDDLRGIARELANHGLCVAVPDPWYRSGCRFETPLSRKDWMRIEPLRVAHTLDRAARDVAFACDALAVEAEAQPGPTGLVGLCIGSGFALGALAAHGERIGPVALLDGCELGDRAGGIPQFPTGLTVPVKIWQTSDEDALADAFGTLLADAGLHPEVARLRGVPHGFCFETWSGERHRATERERTLAEVAAFLSRSSLG